MNMHPSPMTPEDWLLTLFNDRSACRGNIVKRSVRDIDMFVGRARFERELVRRGYQAVENAGQIVVFCNREPIRRIT